MREQILRKPNWTRLLVRCFLKLVPDTLQFFVYMRNPMFAGKVSFNDEPGAERADEPVS